MENRSAKLAAVAAALVAVVAVVALVFTTYDGDDTPTAEPSPTPTRVEGTPAPAGPVTSASTPATAAAEPTDEGGDHEPATPDPEAQAAILETTTRFLAAWKKPGTPAERTKAIGPYATQRLTTQLADVDPANLPTGALQGKPTIETANAFAAATIAEFDGGPRVRCNLVLDPTGWRVAQILPVTTTASPSSTETAGAG
ncbi:MAG TPA: hypothetical protein VI076_09175 [Actinopolymorphaceae bacterium]